MAHMAQGEESEPAGDLLKGYRVAAGLTQEELAERSGVSARTIGSIERGTLHRPRNESLRLLADALAISPQQYVALLSAVRRQRIREAALVPMLAGEQSHAHARQMLPVPPTPLVGRERELALALDMLQRNEVRLLTLYGPPGVGKTRLALQIALDMRDQFADGTIFVALAPFREPDQVMAAIAQAVGLPTTGAQSLEASLCDALADKQVLLVLDNCEQALAAAPYIGHFLGACPHVKVIATSREILRVRGEHELSVAPLALADLAHLPPIEDLERYAAVDLFMQRARAVKPTFALSEENGRVVAEICVHLDGLPLAIELAAARIKLLPPRALLTRLDYRLRLLTHGMQDLPERLHTLRSAVAWSYDLLTAEEQRLFARLAVFNGRWTLEAAEAICAAPGEQGTETLELLTSLVDKSLVQQEEAASGEVRFRMLETIREYAREQLEARSDIEALRRRHAEHYVAYAEGAEPHFTGPEQALWLDRMAAEQGNAREALYWAIDHAKGSDDRENWQQRQGEAVRDGEALELGLRLAGALGVFWSIRGPLSEGRVWLEELLLLAAAREQRGSGMAQAATRRRTIAVRAKALRAAAQLAEHEYNFKRASAWLEESVRLYQELGDREGEAAVLNRLGIATLDAGRYSEATAWFERCLALRREAGDSRGMAGSLTNMGVVALHLGEYAQASSWLADALACFREVGDISASGEVATPTVGIANVLANLGVVTYYRGEYDGAAALLRQCLALFRQLGFGGGAAVSLHFLGNVARERGDMGHAVTLYRESLDLFHSYPNRQGIVQCLEDMGRLASLCGDAERAARLWGAVEALRSAIPGLLRLHGEHARYERDVAALRARLGEEVFAAAWMSGRSLSLEQAITYARGLVALQEGDIQPGMTHAAG